MAIERVCCCCCCCSLVLLLLHYKTAKSVTKLVLNSNLLTSVTTKTSRSTVFSAFVVHSVASKLSRLTTSVFSRSSTVRTDGGPTVTFRLVVYCASPLPLSASTSMNLSMTSWTDSRSSSGPSLSCSMRVSSVTSVSSWPSRITVFLCTCLRNTTLQRAPKSTVHNHSIHLIDLHRLPRPSSASIWTHTLCYG